MSSRRRLPSRRLSARKLSARFDVEAFLANAGAGKTVQEYVSKARVFSQGEKANSVFYVQKGRVRLSVVSARGKEATIALVGRGNFLGEDCIATDQPLRMMTATASTACSLLKIEKSQMLATLHEEPEFSDVFVVFLIARNSRTQADLVDQMFNSSEKRLARALYLLANFGKDKSEKIVPNISQETLAEMIGTTRSRVNFFMNRFRKLGLIEYNGGLRVHSSLLSVVLHD